MRFLRELDPTLARDDIAALFKDVSSLDECLQHSWLTEASTNVNALLDNAIVALP
jgi:hypothetical protein